MFKNMQFKIILIFFLVGIILIGTLGTIYISSLNSINEQIQSEIITNSEQIKIGITQLKHNMIVTLIIVTVAFFIIGCLISAFLSKFVIYPINKLIKSAEKITDEEKRKKLKKKKTDVDELENAFG